MVKLFTYFFDKWWRPILFFGFTVGLVMVDGFMGNKTFGKTSALLFCMGLLALVVSTIYQFSKKRWLRGILTGLLFGGTILGLAFYAFLLLFLDMPGGDKWAD